MKFLRKFDDIGARLAHSQAMIFERSIEEGLPSRTFIRCYMLSEEVRSIDELSLETAGRSEVEIFQSIRIKLKSKRGHLLSYPLMHFIGYFYRAASYISGYNSKQLYFKIPVEFLIRNYLVLHTYSIEEAVKEAFQILEIEDHDLYLRFKEIYSRY